VFDAELKKHLNHNFVVNVMDGAFFGLALGFASYVTVIPLFIDSLTDAAWIIGFIASIHQIGWQLPQILTAGRVARLKRYLPMVMWMTFQERWPIFGLAVVALLVGMLGNTLALILAFVLVCWQALGGGFTATAWQTMIGKIIPLHRRGTFWGVQAAAASILIAVGGYLSGQILEKVAYPTNFVIVFSIAGVAMMVSMGFLGATREPAHQQQINDTTQQKSMSWSRFGNILRQDANLRVFLWARFFSQFAYMAISFYTVFGVRQFGMDEGTAGILLGVMTLSQTVANPILGGLGDYWGHRRVFAFGMVMLSLSAFGAMVASDVSWLYGVFILAGIGHAVIWTTSMTMTLEFGPENERPYYIGLVNTLIAPATLGAPIIGGILADTVGFEWTFALAGIMALMTAGILFFIMREPRARREAATVAVAHGIAGD